MRRRLFTASASAIGFVSLLQGVVFVRLGSLPLNPATLRGLLTLGNVGAVLAIPRTVNAAPKPIPTAVPVAPEVLGAPSTTIDLDVGSASPAVEGDRAVCPSAMVLVEGEYCPEVVHECKHWLEEKGKFAFYRCAEYSSAKCVSKQRVHKRFCMDRDEYAPEGEKLPSSHVAWNDATKTCAAQGKRVCLESEWNFACEGEEMRPYPYGWKRDPDACNADRTDIYRADGQLRDLRVGANDKPECVSPFGVHNLSGNLEEWTTLDRSAGSNEPKPAMKGAYWQPSRNHCRAAQTAHDRFYKGTETGFRCCADPE